MPGMWYTLSLFFSGGFCTMLASLSSWTVCWLLNFTQYPCISAAVEWSMTMPLHSFV